MCPNKHLTRAVLLSLLAAGLTAGQPAQALFYALTDLGTFTNVSGGTESQPYGINDAGNVAASAATNGHYRAFLHSGTWSNLGTLGGAESYASSVNRSNWVTGHASTSNGVLHAFLWIPGATNGVPGNPQMFDIGRTNGASDAARVNAFGQAVGFQETNTSKAIEYHAFLYSYSNNVIKDIGSIVEAAVSGGKHSYAYGVNDAGHAVGEAYNNSFSSSGAFLYLSNSVAISLGNLGGGSSSALAINNSDQITGYSTTTNGTTHAFRYRAGTMTDLGSLGGSYSAGRAINNSNVIVGGSYTNVGDTVYHAFIAVSNTMVDLNTLLDPGVTNWVLQEATGINDAGQITGLGTRSGNHRGFRLTPFPQPDITGFVFSDVTNVVLNFLTASGSVYAVESRTNLLTGGWSNVLTGITGTGAPATATNVDAVSLPARFYRVRRTTPP